MQRLSVYSWGEYWTSLKNRLDFVVTWALTIAVLHTAVLVNNPGDNGSVKPLMMLRLLRLMALVSTLGDMRVVFDTLTLVLPGFKLPVANFFMVVYFFSCLGVREAPMHAPATTQHTHQHTPLTRRTSLTGTLQLAVFGGLIYEGAEGYPFSYTKAGSELQGSGNVFHMNDFL